MKGLRGRGKDCVRSLGQKSPCRAAAGPETVPWWREAMGAGERCGWQGRLVQGSVLCCHVQGLPLKGCKPWSSASRFTFGKDYHVLCELSGPEDHWGTLAALGRC